MLGILEAFPRQAERGRDIGKAIRLPASFTKGIGNVVCTGLGGSAIGADIARSLTQGEISVPVFVNRSYALPEFTGRDSLLIVSSYSGNTEETISAYRQGRGKRAKIIVITSGGVLARQAAKDGVPVVLIPPGLPPRCSLGYSFFPLLYLLSKAGLISDKTRDVNETIGVLRGLEKRELGMCVRGPENRAKSLAKSLFGRFPVIYSACDRVDSAATRWRGQLAENAKTLASSHLFPEMCHNEIVGWDNPRFMLNNSSVVMLRDAGDLGRVAKRMDIVKDILKRQGVETLEVWSSGRSLLARIFSLIYTGDYASFYLAIANRRDPTPVDRIAYLKERLARS